MGVNSFSDIAQLLAIFIKLIKLLQYVYILSIVGLLIFLRKFSCDARPRMRFFFSIVSLM